MDDQNRPDNRMDDFQRTYENTPETYETAAGEPVEPTPTQQTPVTAPKKKSSVGKWLLWAVVVVLLAGLGALAFWQWNDARNARAEASFWHSALQVAQKQNKKDTAADKTSVPEGKDFIDETAVESAARASVEAFMSTSGVTRMQYEATIPYMDESFARVVVNYMVPDPTSGKQKPSGKGETFFFKKVKVGDESAAWAMIAINPMTTEEINSMKNRYGVTDKVITGNNPR